MTKEALEEIKMCIRYDKGLDKLFEEGVTVKEVNKIATEMGVFGNIPDCSWGDGSDLDDYEYCCC